MTKSGYLNLQFLLVLWIIGSTGGSERNKTENPTKFEHYSSWNIVEKTTESMKLDETVQKEPRSTKKSEGHDYGNDKAAERPNIILIITDDQDIELGSMESMPLTLKEFRDGGIEFRHGYATTPMCCPSRSSMLTGLYMHNHNVFTNNANCSSIYWRENYEKKTFASYLWNSGYYTAYIGKYLNKYDGSHIPFGWDEWNAQLMNSRYYNYSLNRNGKRIRYGSNYFEGDYYPEKIGTDALEFLGRMASRDDGKNQMNTQNVMKIRPFLLVLSFPSPHGPEDSAPKHCRKFFNATSHHNPSYDYAPNLDKQWILRVTDKMSTMSRKFSDLLMTKRLQTLQSVDEIVAVIFEKLRHSKLIDSTYVFYISDHGYHVGQYGLVKGKSMPFEFDVRIPFFVTGPNALLQKRVVAKEPVLNIDIAPTFLDLAGIQIPPEMDGRSMVPLLKKYSVNASENESLEWGDVFLIESSGKRTSRRRHTPFSKNKRFKASRKNKNKSSFILDNETTKINKLCVTHPHPCYPGQKKYCRMEKNRVRFRKCKKNIDFIQGYPSLSSSGSRRHLQSSDQEEKFMEDSRSHYKAACNCKKGRRNKRQVSSDETDWSAEKRFLESEIQRVRNELANLRKRRREIKLKIRRNRFLQVDSLKHTLDSNNKQPLKISEEEDDYFLSEELDKMSGELEASLIEMEHLESLEVELSSESGIQSNVEASSEGDLTYFSAGNSDSQDSFEDDELIDSKLLALGNISFPLSSNEYLLYGESPEEAEADMSAEATFLVTDRNDQDNQHSDLDNQRNSKECDCLEETQSSWLHQRELQERKRKKLINKLRKKERLRKRFNDPTERHMAETCGKGDKMNCFWHDNSHWKTEPLWTEGSFCFCLNANNNSYSCIRSVNSTHNYLYCQFVTGFKMYFDMNEDPYQLSNSIGRLPAWQEDWILAQLLRLKRCSGAEECWSHSEEQSNSRKLEPPSIWGKIFGRSGKRKRRRKF